MNKGFTLVELLVVIVIVGIIGTASITAVNPLSQLKKSRDSKRKADIGQMQAAFELYRSDQGSYPTLPLPGCSASLVVSGTTYLKSMPCDPKNTGQYKYTYIPAGIPITTYTIRACLENVRDDNKDDVNNAVYCTGGSTNWSYTVSNP